MSLKRHGCCTRSCAARRAWPCRRVQLDYTYQLVGRPEGSAGRTADNEIVGFEGAAHNNGESTWSAREFGAFLGYADYRTFRSGPIERAIVACMNASIPVSENFRDATSVIEGRSVPDLLLTRFGCYVVAMNADPKKERVAEAQVYFAGLADTFKDYLDAAAEVERLAYRGELTQSETDLSATAQRHGVHDFALFQSAGYRGMYNMSMGRLRLIKSVPSGRSPLDFMRSRELAANLFRITQTDAKITNENLVGQGPLESAAEEVGTKVRQAMIELSGTPPEALPAADDIRGSRKTLKRTHKSLRQLRANIPD
jgi:DNA-damage-inducible protein D